MLSRTFLTMSFIFIFVHYLLWQHSWLHVSTTAAFICKRCVDWLCTDYSESNPKYWLCIWPMHYFSSILPFFIMLTMHDSLVLEFEVHVYIYSARCGIGSLMHNKPISLPSQVLLVNLALMYICLPCSVLWFFTYSVLCHELCHYLASKSKRVPSCTVLPVTFKALAAIWCRHADMHDAPNDEAGAVSFSSYLYGSFFWSLTRSDRVPVDPPQSRSAPRPPQTRSFIHHNCLLQLRFGAV